MLFDTAQYTKTIEDFTSDDWETPPKLARFIASLILLEEKLILSPGAGRGNIEAHIPKDREIWAIEAKFNRVEDGRLKLPHINWVRSNFLEFSGAEFDVAIGNPPFSDGLSMAFIAHSLHLLKPDGRILFILPTDHFQAQERARLLTAMGATIYHKYDVVGRVGFIREGVIEPNPQRYHSIFDIRKCGRSGVSLVWI